MALQKRNRSFGPAVPVANSESGSASDVLDNLRTYMYFNDRVSEAVRENFRKNNLYRYSWKEISNAFETILGEVADEDLKNKMKKRFGEFEQDKFTVPVSNVIEDNQQDTAYTPKSGATLEGDTARELGDVNKPVTPASNADDNPQVQIAIQQAKSIKADDNKRELVMKAVDEYIYSRERKAKYAKEIVEAAKQKDIALSILKHLNAEAEKKVKSGMPKIKRSNLFKLAIAVGAKSFDDEDVQSSLKILLYEISDQCQDDFIRFEAKKEDFKDSFLQYMPMVESVAERFGMADFMEEIRQIHKDSLCAILKDEKVLKKYEALFANYSARAAERAKVRKEAALKRETERKAREEEKKRKEEKKKRKAEEKTAAKDQADTAKKDKTEKDTVSENGNKKDKTKTAEDTSTPTQPKKGAGKMTEENEFTPSEVQKEACKKARIEDIGQFKDESSLIAALKERGYEIKNNEVLPINSSDGNGENNEKAGKEDETGGKPKEGAGKEGETDDKSKPVEVNTGPVKEKDPEIHEEAPEIAEWVKEKRVEYQKRFENKEIAGYEFDPNEKVGFAAHVEGGYIHYTNKNSVTVSPDSKLKVFEALVTEGHNKGRPVNFGPNLEHKQAVLLLAACLIHGNPVGNNPPELSPEDLEMLKRDLEGRTIKDKDGKEIPAYAALEESLSAYTAGKKKEEAGRTDEPKTEETDGKPKEFDDETKGKIKEAMNNQYEMAALESSGKIDENKEKYDELKSKQADDKKLLAQKFIDNPEGVRALMKELINEKAGKTEAKEVTFAERRNVVMMKMKAKEDDKVKDADKEYIADRRKKLQKEMKIALGIKDPEKGLKDKELEKYIKDNNITAYTYGRLGGTSEGIAKLCKPLEGSDVMKDFDAGKATLKEVMSKVNKVKNEGRSK